MRLPPRRGVRHLEQCLRGPGHHRALPLLQDKLQPRHHGPGPRGGHPGPPDLAPGPHPDLHHLNPDPPAAPLSPHLLHRLPSGQGQVGVGK